MSSMSRASGSTGWARCCRSCPSGSEAGRPVVGDDLDADEAAHAHEERGLRSSAWAVEPISTSAASRWRWARAMASGWAAVLSSRRDDAHPPLARRPARAASSAPRTLARCWPCCRRAARHHRDVVEPRGRPACAVDGPAPLEYVGSTACRRRPAAPPLEVTGGLDVVVAVQQQCRARRRAREFAHRAGVPVPSGPGKSSARGRCPPERAHRLDHGRGDLAADGGNAQVTVRAARDDRDVTTRWLLQSEACPRDDQVRSDAVELRDRGRFPSARTDASKRRRLGSLCEDERHERGQPQPGCALDGPGQQLAAHTAALDGGAHVDAHLGVARRPGGRRDWNDRPAEDDVPCSASPTHNGRRSVSARGTRLAGWGSRTGSVSRGGAAARDRPRCRSPRWGRGPPRARRGWRQGRRATGRHEPVSIASRRRWFAEHSPSAGRCGWRARGHHPRWLSFQSFYGRPAYAADGEVSVYVSATVQRSGVGRQLLARASSAHPGWG